MPPLHNTKASAICDAIELMRTKAQGHWQQRKQQDMEGVQSTVHCLGDEWLDRLSWLVAGAAALASRLRMSM